MICFAFQIYCDFSGYSDIAIGTARVFGYDLMKNFKSPYFASSLTDFWRRWHISLSTWFKDYVYIPIGGNKVLKWRWYFNLWITFLISGIWHGANWTFVLWGAIHGFGLVIENILSYKRSDKFLLFKKLWIFSLICLAWIFFRANTISDAFTIIGNILSFDHYNASQLSLNIVPTSKNAVFSMDFILAYAGVFTLLFTEHQLIVKNRWRLIPKNIKLVLFSVATVAFLLLGVFDINEFIYFQF